MAQDTNIPPFLKDSLDKSKFPGAFGDSLMSLYRLNFEMLATTQKIAMETAQTLITLNQQYQKRVYEQMNDIIKYNLSKGPLEEKTPYQAKAAKDVVDLMSEHAMEVGSLLVDSNKRLTDTVQKGVKEGMEETINAAKKTKE